MEGLLVYLSLCSIFGGNTTVSANMVLLELIVLSCPSLSYSEPVLVGRKKGMHNKTLCSRLLRIHLLLQCLDVSSRLHMLEAGETSWKQRGLLMAFPFSCKAFGALRGLASILEKVLQQDSMSPCLFSALRGYSAVTVTFVFNSSFQICSERQTICKLFVPPICRK